LAANCFGWFKKQPEELKILREEIDPDRVVIGRP